MAQYDLNLRDYYRIFRRRKVTILLIFCMVMGGAYYYLSSQKVVYQSSIKVQYTFQAPVTGMVYGRALPADYVIKTHLEIIKSHPVAERAAKILGWLEGLSDPREIDQMIQKIKRAIATEQIGETSVIRITATTPEAETARQIVEAVAKAYLAFDQEEKGRTITTVRAFIEGELKKAVEKLKASEEALKRFQEGTLHTSRAGQFQEEIASLELKLQDLLARATPRHPDVERLQQQLDTAKEELRRLPQEELTFSRLTQEVGSNQKVVSQLRERFNAARIEEAENVTDLNIIEGASPPRPTFGTNRSMGLTLSAVLGILVGFVFAFFKEGLDTSIGAIEEMESFLGVRVLGVIPHIVKESGKKKLFSSPFKNQEERARSIQLRLITQFDPRSPEAESYHTLRTAIYSVLPQKEKLAIGITSTAPREGKSITSANLAIASAQIGKKTLLIDADFRRPVIHQFFKMDRSPGLFEVLTKTVSHDRALKNITDLLMGDAHWQEALKTPHLAYLNFLTAGHLPTNPPELFHSAEMGELIRSLLVEFDILIFDAPPILPVTDTLILAPKLDGVILVYQAGRTARNALKRAKVLLDTAQAKVLGVVFNDFKPVEIESTSSYYYRYRKYYSDEMKKELKKEAENEKS
ncbi:MAG: AAA family ATPase [Candidatus Omnitrophica bacterium]|nr:AAA family ATPase [Candidatus Omnitrophota bacterium]